MTTSEFILAVKDQAIACYSAGSCFASITIAQAILESAHGTSGLSDVSNNLFGMKGRYNGQYVLYPTQEWNGSKYITIQAEFKKYPSWNESIADHATLINRPYYETVRTAGNYVDAAQALQDLGYATDPTYAQQLIDIISYWNLMQYDVAVTNIVKHHHRLLPVMKRFYFVRRPQQ